MASRKIAVIGGGIFGLEIATALMGIGHQVTLFEKENGVMLRTTSNNQNRLHLGLHYPRDMKTARQSRFGFDKFINKYPESVKTGFTNYYAVSSESTQTSTEAFVKFANSAEIPITPISVNGAKDLGFNVKLIDSLWACNEAVVDIRVYRKLALEAAASVNLPIMLSTEISSAGFDGKYWRLNAHGVDQGSFDFIVRAAYGQDRMVINIEPENPIVYEFQQTLVFEVSSKAKSFGLTVVDGDFVTILPRGFSDNFLIYSPLPSVLNRYVGESVPRNWNFDDKPMIESSFNKVSERARNYAPVLGEISLTNVLTAIRALQPFVSKTDQRISFHTNPYPNFYDIRSGKIDHAIEIAESLCTLLPA